MNKKNSRLFFGTFEQRVFLYVMSVTVLMLMPTFGWSAAGDLGNACNAVEEFLAGAKTILTAIAVAVVTIAIMIAGYQVAFAHKRLGDVLPIVVGGILIGSAAQIASWLAPAAKCGGS